MDDIKAKQQLVEKIKEATNILVTVSDNPTVDALSAAIGLTLLIDKLDKHATAVFSGVVPPAIAFLEPEKILDDTTDSLRDFIIALDKEKADHLRYKIEGESVKIFITPYKTTISSDDLEFSQGDYNVELVIALGVSDQDHLDGALESHGQILHDATVATITAGEETSDLGGIDWHDDQASSLSELIAGLSEALKPQKGKSLLDAQIATAFLTGIVAETERFSNKNTTSKAMTVASQLMAAGADQQLIATQLEESYRDAPEPVEAPKPEELDSVEPDGTLHIGKHREKDSEPTPEPASLPIQEAPAPAPALPVPDVPEPYEDPELPRPQFETLEEMDRRVKTTEQAEAAAVAEAALDQTANETAESVYAAAPTPAPTPAPETAPNPSVMPSTSEIDITDEPTFSGTLNATTEQAAEDSRREEMSDQNKTILNHSYLQSQGAEVPTLGVESESTTETAGDSFVLSNDGAPHLSPLSPAGPFVTAPTPTDLGLPMPPPLPDFSQGAPVAAGPYALPGAAPQQPERLGDIFAPEPEVGLPLPAINFPPTETPPAIEPAGPYAPPPSAPNDPNQFKIPGQS